MAAAMVLTTIIDEDEVRGGKEESKRVDEEKNMDIVTTSSVGCKSRTMQVRKK